MRRFYKFDDAIRYSANALDDYGYVVHTEKWQGKEIKEDEKMAMFETLNHSFSCAINPDLEELKKQIEPNLPWADDHFQERIGGLPLNPGREYKNWPYYKHNPSNDQFRVEQEKFSHSYAERIWPLHAGQFEDEELYKNGNPRGVTDLVSHKGIRYEYGDLDDMINLLIKEPFTRQAYLPIWFPEDTGVKHGGRIPCSLGYHFIRRHNYLHVNYYIRSCDFFRHFRDDIYLCARKNLWLLEELTKRDSAGWKDVLPGMLTMHITSLHIFKNERSLLKKHGK